MEFSMPTELRYVYRALLRGATYLPDSAARKYVHNTVVDRFRDVSNKIRRRKKGPPQQGLIDRYHGSDHIAHLRRRANKIQRASLGSEDDLKDVLMHTYGRLGRRRFQMMHAFRNYEGMSPSIPAPQEMKDVFNGVFEEHDLERGPRSRLQALIRGQSDGQRDLPKQSTSLMRKLRKKNIWGREHPLKVQANLKKRIFKHTLSKIYPPVSADEWDRLRDLANGTLPVESLPPRRPRAGAKEFISHREKDVRLLEYFTTPVEVSKPSLKTVSFTEQGITCGQQTEPDFHRKNIYTERFMRRMYATIWSITPKMIKDEQSGEWTSTIGSAAGWIEGRISAPTPADAELFEGLGEETTSQSLPQGKSRSRGRKKSGWKSDYSEPWREPGYKAGAMPTLPN